MADKSVFGMDKEDLADALEAIYKRQSKVETQTAAIAALVEEIKTHVIALRTTVVSEPSVAADSGSDEGDGVPPLVKWALSQPWGIDLMHGLTDKDMIGGIVKLGLGWLKDKATGAVAGAIDGAASAAGAGSPKAGE